MTYEHFIYTDTPDKLAVKYQRAGFIAEADSEGLVMVYTAYDEAIRAEVMRIADEHGADYDGGGMYVGPLEGLS